MSRGSNIVQFGARRPKKPDAMLAEVMRTAILDGFLATGWSTPAASDAAEQVAAIAVEHVGKLDALKAFRFTWNIPLTMTLEDAMGQIQAQVAGQVQSWADEVYGVARQAVLDGVAVATVTAIQAAMRPGQG